jgi:hypothetical protein
MQDLDSVLTHHTFESVQADVATTSEEVSMVDLPLESLNSSTQNSLRNSESMDSIASSTEVLQEIEPVFVEKWRAATLEQRATIYKIREIEYEKEFGERIAIVRTPECMQDFTDSQQLALKPIEKVAKKSMESEQDSIQEEEIFLPELMPLAGCFPYSQIQPKPPQLMQSLSRYSKAQISSSSHICTSIQQNIQVIKNIKEQQHKIQSFQVFFSFSFFSWAWK